MNSHDPQLDPNNPEARLWALKLALIPDTHDDMSHYHPVMGVGAGDEGDDVFIAGIALVDMINEHNGDTSGAIRVHAAGMATDTDGDVTQGSGWFDVIRMGEIPADSMDQLRQINAVDDGIYYMDMWVDDEGILLEKAPNPLASAFAGRTVAGNALVTLSDQYGDTVPMSGLLAGLLAEIIEAMTNRMMGQIADNADGVVKVKTMINPHSVINN